MISLILIVVFSKRSWKRCLNCGKFTTLFYTYNDRIHSIRTGRFCSPKCCDTKVWESIKSREGKDDEIG